MCTVDSWSSFYLNGKALSSSAFHCSSNEGPTFSLSESFTSPTPLLYGSCQACNISFTNLPCSHLLSFPFIPVVRSIEAVLSHSLSIPPSIPDLLVFIFYTSRPFCPLTPSCFYSFFAPKSSVLGCQYLRNNAIYSLLRQYCSPKAFPYYPIGTNYSRL